MSAYNITIAIKYTITLLIENDSKEDAEEQAVNDALESLPVGAVPFEGCPYVIDTKERS